MNKETNSPAFHFCSRHDSIVEDPAKGCPQCNAERDAGSDEEIMEIADRWFCTGENQHKSDGYYYRSLGTPTNVRGSDLIEFARALLQRSQGQEPVAEGFVDQHGKVINASATIGYLRPCPEDAANGCKIIPLFTHPAPVAVVPAEQAEDWPSKAQLAKWALEAIEAGQHAAVLMNLEGIKDHLRRAAMSNREAGGS